jgi:pyruvate kinase
MQKKMAALCSYYNRPIIIATQLVLSMVQNIQPTRAEVSDVGNAIFEGADAIMTSDETTKSPHPVLVIKTMAKIAKETESNIYSICERPDCDDCFGVLHRGRLQRSGFETNVGLRRHANKSKKKSNLNSDSIKRKFSCTSLDVSPNTFKENIISILPFVTDDIECLVAVSNKDDEYIKNIAASRLNIPMFGFTSNKMLCNQMNLIWNVQSIFDEKINDDYVNNMRRVDEYMKERDITKYLLVGDLVTNGKKCTTIQVRNL